MDDWTLVLPKMMPGQAWLTCGPCARDMQQNALWSDMNAVVCIAEDTVKELKRQQVLHCTICVQKQERHQPKLGCHVG